MDLVSTIFVGSNSDVENRLKTLAVELLATDNYASHPDFIQIQQDSRSIGIKEVNKFKSQLYVKPFQSENKIGVIYKAERLTTQAQNALLKILEEPPTNTQIALTISNESSLLDTIRSRCVVEYIGSNEKTPVAASDISEFIESSLIEKYSFVENLHKIKSPVERGRETRLFLINLRKYYLSLIKSDKSTREKTHFVLKLIDSTSRHLEANSNFRLTLENLIVHL